MKERGGIMKKSLILLFLISLFCYNSTVLANTAPAPVVTVQIPESTPVQEEEKQSSASKAIEATKDVTKKTVEATKDATDKTVKATKKATKKTVEETKE